MTSYASENLNNGFVLGTIFLSFEIGHGNHYLTNAAVTILPQSHIVNIALPHRILVLVRDQAGYVPYNVYSSTQVYESEYEVGNG